MPFTPSHVAAVLPLLRGPGRRLPGRDLPAAGLVIGSMVPDLPYYLPPGVVIDSGFTHSLAGVVTLDLVLGVVCVAVWHELLGPAGVLLAPVSLRVRLAPGAPAPLRRLLGTPAQVARLALALMIGALTHVVWDAFTHENGWGAAHLGWLAEVHGPLPGYRWAQYASGLIGGLAVVVWLWRWWRGGSSGGVGEPGQHEPGRAGVQLPAAARWACLAAVATALLIGALAGGLIALHEEAGVRHLLFVIATAGGGAAAASSVLLAAVVRLTHPRQVR